MPATITTKKSIMSPEPLFRPRLSRYDRSALTLAELLRAEGTDFIFQAVWTLHGRRTSRAQHDALLELLHRPRGKMAVLAALETSLPQGAELNTLPGLRRMLLVERRRNTSLVGPLLSWATVLADRHPGAMMPVRFVRSLPGKARWTYRHSRKLLIRLASRSGLPSQTDVRRTLGVARAPAGPDMSERSAWIYARLCEVVDRSEGEA